MPPSQEDRTQSAVPVNERLLRLDQAKGNGAVLLGGRCPECGQHFFPRRAICAACGHVGLDAVDLSTKGSVWSYTIARQAPPAALVEAPYVIGQIELRESVLVSGLVQDCTPEQAKIGMEVELVPVKVREDDEGRDVLAFAFRPAGEEEQSDEQ